MEFNKEHAQAVTDLMRTRFPLRGDNWRKNSRTFLPRWGKPQGEHNAPYGDVFTGSADPAYVPVARLYVYDPDEPDRPAFVKVNDVVAARDYVRILSEYIAAVESKEAN